VSKNVLIADDSASMRRSVRFLLERRHSELLVSEAVDGVDAIEKAEETKPDLILLDLAPPEWGGSGLGLEDHSAGNANYSVHDVYRFARRFF
jgi:CheY-like chemotaxis protein